MPSLYPSLQKETTGPSQPCADRTAPLVRPIHSRNPASPRPATTDHSVLPSGLPLCSPVIGRSSSYGGTHHRPSSSPMPSPSGAPSIASSTACSWDSSVTLLLPRNNPPHTRVPRQPTRDSSHPGPDRPARTSEVQHRRVTNPVATAHHPRARHGDLARTESWPDRAVAASGPARRWRATTGQPAECALRGASATYDSPYHGLA